MGTRGDCHDVARAHPASPHRIRDRRSSVRVRLEIVIRPGTSGGPADTTVRVLVVDDHQMFAASLAHALQS
jgi:hypothetical protein